MNEDTATIQDDPVGVVEDDLTEDMLSFYFGESDEQETEVTQ